MTGSQALPRSRTAVNRGKLRADIEAGQGSAPKLVPESGVEAVGPALFRAISAEPWLRIDLDRMPAGRWIRLRYRTGLLADPVRPLLRMAFPDGRAEIDIMAGPVCGAAAWVCRVPPGVIGLSVSPAKEVGLFAFALDELSVLGRGRLLLGALRRKPGLALTSTWLRVKGKRVRARHFIKSIWASTSLDRYADWLAARSTASLPEPAPEVRAEVTIVVDARGRSEADLARTIESLSCQDPPPDWRVIGAGGNRESLPGPGWVGILRAGDVLAPEAMATMTAAIARDPALTAIYSDEDESDAEGRRSRPKLKPDWSPRLQAAAPYVGGLLLVRAELVSTAEQGTDAADDLAAALFAPGARVGHVRRILYHRAASGVAGPNRRPEPVVATAPDPLPRVSIVIPNRDRLNLLEPCVEGLRHRTEYPDLEIVIVDNGSEEPATHAYYRSLGSDSRVRVLDRPGPFNFSALTNAGVAASTGEVVVLLNNDIAVVGPDWLERMVVEAARPEVGAVGAKLLYPDDRLQHGGVVVGLGGAAGHIYRGRPGDAGGWLDRLHVTHEVSAVTAACLAVARAKYEGVGGLDEELFPVSFNDIDLCLKLQAAGWTNLMVPGAVLYHHESASRGHDHAGAKQKRAEREAAAFAEKWLPVMRDDPYFHPGFSLLRFDVSLG